MYKVEFTYSQPSWDTFETDDAVDKDEAEYQAEQHIKTCYPEAYDIEILKVTEVDG